MVADTHFQSSKPRTSILPASTQSTLIFGSIGHSATPNHSIEGMSSRLRRLATPHVKR